jgi:hypothetical protein
MFTRWFTRSSQTLSMPLSESKAVSRHAGSQFVRASCASCGRIRLSVCRLAVSGQRGATSGEVEFHQRR